jgi:hypothetical protein
MARWNRRPRDRVPVGDGLDGPAWDGLVAAVTAAHRFDLDAFRRTVVALDGCKSMDPRAPLYLLPLLMCRTGALLRPGWQEADLVEGDGLTEAELRALATQVWPTFRRVIREDEQTLATVFLMAWNLEPNDDPSFVGIQFTTFGAAALACLLDDPRSQLDELRPLVARWYWRIRDELVVDLGPYDVRPPRDDEKAN